MRPNYPARKSQTLSSDLWNSIAKPTPKRQDSQTLTEDNSENHNRSYRKLPRYPVWNPKPSTIPILTNGKKEKNLNSPSCKNDLDSLDEPNPIDDSRNQKLDQRQATSNWIQQQALLSEKSKRQSTESPIRKQRTEPSPDLNSVESTAIARNSLTCSDRQISSDISVVKQPSKYVDVKHERLNNGVHMRNMTSAFSCDSSVVSSSKSKTLTLSSKTPYTIASKAGSTEQSKQNFVKPVILRPPLQNIHRVSQKQSPSFVQTATIASTAINESRLRTQSSIPQSHDNQSDLFGSVTSEIRTQHTNRTSINHDSNLTSSPVRIITIPKRTFPMMNYKAKSPSRNSTTGTITPISTNQTHSQFTSSFTRKRFVPDETNLSPIVETQTAFKTTPLSHVGIPNHQIITVNQQFGSLSEYLGALTLRLHDNSIIPGGPLRALIYVIVKKTLQLNEVVLNFERTLRFTPGLSGEASEDVTQMTYLCLTSKNRLKQLRTPPESFSMKCPEFTQPANAMAALNEACYWPFQGPVSFPPGQYAIPCIIPTDPTIHPSLKIKQSMNRTNSMELTHFFTLHATLEFSIDNTGKHLSVNTGQLPVKVLSCGPLPKRLPTGSPIPAISETFITNGVSVLIQADQLVVQEGQAFNFYVFVNQLDAIQLAEAHLLQTFHVPFADLGDENSLMKSAKYPKNVIIRDQTKPVVLNKNLGFPFTAEAEKQSTSGELFHQSLINLNRYSVPAVAKNTPINSNIKKPMVDALSRNQRVAGCVLTLRVPPRTIPQLNFGEFRISYYVRILLTFKEGVTAYSIPITVVETQVKNYVIKYLSKNSTIQDSSFFKMGNKDQCNVS